MQRFQGDLSWVLLPHQQRHWLPAWPRRLRPVKLQSARQKAWAVGTWGEFDWCHVWAFDEEQAIRIHALNEGMVDPETGEIERHYDAQRCEAWDDLKSDPTPADWIRANMGHLCSRCGHECSGDCGDGNAVGDEAVCTDCMTLADWDVIDPEYAAELREEQGHG